MQGKRVVSERTDSLPSLRLIKASVQTDVVCNNIFLAGGKQLTACRTVLELRLLQKQNAPLCLISNWQHKTKEWSTTNKKWSNTKTSSTNLTLKSRYPPLTFGEKNHRKDFLYSVHPQFEPSRNLAAYKHIASTSLFLPRCPECLASVSKRNKKTGLQALVPCLDTLLFICRDLLWFKSTVTLN